MCPPSPPTPQIYIRREGYKGHATLGNMKLFAFVIGALFAAQASAQAAVAAVAVRGHILSCSG